MLFSLLGLEFAAVAMAMSCAGAGVVADEPREMVFMLAASAALAALVAAPVAMPAVRVVGVKAVTTAASVVVALVKSFSGFPNTSKSKSASRSSS